MNSREIQTTGITLAFFFMFKAFKVLDYPTGIVVLALLYPLLSDRLVTLLAVMNVFNAFSGSLVIFYLTSDFMVSQFHPLPKYIIYPFTVFYCEILFLIWFRIARAIFKKIGLDDRMKAIF